MVEFKTLVVLIRRNRKCKLNENWAFWTAYFGATLLRGAFAFLVGSVAGSALPKGQAPLPAESLDWPTDRVLSALGGLGGLTLYDLIALLWGGSQEHVAPQPAAQNQAEFPAELRFAAGEGPSTRRVSVGTHSPVRIRILESGTEIRIGEPPDTVE